MSWLITRTHDRTAKCPCCRQLFAELDMVKITPPTASCTSIQDISSTTSAFFGGGSSSASIRGGGSFFQPSPRMLTILPPQNHPDGAATAVGPSVETTTQRPELQEQAPVRLATNVASPPLTRSLHAAAGEDELLLVRDSEASIATGSPTEQNDDQHPQQQCCPVSLAANDKEDEKQDHGVVPTCRHPS